MRLSISLRSKNLWLVVVFMSLIGSPAVAKGGAMNEKQAPATASPYPKVAIASIWQNPAAWEGRKIFLEVKLGRWRPHPSITKSDQP
jgi:hypothetical protein